MGAPVVAIVGRPNVGKSTLFNRVVGKRIAIVEDTSGITRDRIYAEALWNGKKFVVIDTGGILLNEEDPLKNEVTVQAQVALEEADVIVLVVDVMTGVSPLDEEIVEMLRMGNKPVIVAANKADNDKRELDTGEFYQLGLDRIFPISALNGRTVADMLDEVVNTLPDEGAAPDYPEETIRIAILGRPNVGKSSFVNAILGQKRAIVSDIPGTTRDSVDSPFRWNDQDIVLIDTAGIRKSGKIQGSVEYYTVLRAVRAMERSDVAAIVIDANDGLKDGDKRVAGLAHDAGRAMVIVVNKWDLCEGKDIQEFAQNIRLNLPFADYAPIVFVSALKKTGITPAVETAIDAAANHAMRIPTGELNRIIQYAQDDLPYSRKGREFKVRYATMSEVKPPTIVLFVNDTDLAHFSYIRYLENQIRREFSYEGTPLKIVVKKAKKVRK